MRTILITKTACLGIIALGLAPLALATEYREPSAVTAAETLTAQGLVEAVLARNPSLAELHAAARQAAARVEPAGSLADPRLSYAIAPETIGGYTTPGGLDRGVSQRIELSQAIPWPGTLALRKASARSEAEAASRSVADQRLQIIAAIKAGFGDWYYVHRALEINRDNQDLLVELRNIAETQYAAGRATQQDVLRAEVAHARLQDKALALKRQKRSIRAQLNGLLNRSPDKPLPPPAELSTPERPAGFQALRRVAVNTHPELMRLQARLDASEAQVGLAEKDFYPDFKLQAGYNNLWDAGEKRFTVGVGINIPLDRGKYNARLDSAKAGELKARWRLIDRRAQLLASLERARAKVDESIEAIRLHRDRLVPLAIDNLQAAEADYRAGASDFQNVTDAENQKLATELRLIRARANYIRRLAELERWAGGRLPSQEQPR